MAQTFSDLEFVIVDDGSTDGSAAVLEDARDRDPRVKLIRQQNTGLTRALNAGLRACSGQYIARQDADDYSMPERIERQCQFMDINPGVVLLGTDYVMIDDENLPITTICNSGKKNLREAVGKSNPFIHGSMMFRREIADTAVLYDEYYVKAQDYDLALRLSEQGDVAILPQVLYEWRHSRFGILASNITIYGERARENFLRRHAGLPEERGEVPKTLLSAKPSDGAFDISLAQRFISGYELGKARRQLMSCLFRGNLQPSLVSAWARLLLVSLLPTSFVRRLRER